MDNEKKACKQYLHHILRNIEVRPIHRSERYAWDELMAKYHYLGLRSLVGESLRYIALYQGQWLALLGWAAAALKCSVRDAWIGWPNWIKWQRLPLVANNVRFLILPHISIRNLASRILALNLKRLSEDWQTSYAHPILLAETFVNPRMFKGTCYKAANWTFLGHTRGFAKSAQTYKQHDQPKMIFVRPLNSQVRSILSNPELNINLKKEIKPMKLSSKNADSLMQTLLSIKDHRMPRGVRHNKISILAISICAIVCGARSFAAISEWALRCSQNMFQRLGCRYNTKKQCYEPPSEPTIRRFLQCVDAQCVDQALCCWLQGIAGKHQAIAVDGKTLRGARRPDGHQVHLLSAFLHQQGIVLSQCEVDGKTNEIPTVPTLLDPLDLKDCVVTLDAMHTQKNTARYLVKQKKADYLFIVKDNQSTLKQDIHDLQMKDFSP